MHGRISARLLGALTLISPATGCYQGLDSSTFAQGGVDSAGGTDSAGGPDSGPGGDDPASQACERDATPAATIRRLTRQELLQSIEAIVGSEIMASASVTQAAALLPEESPGDLVADFQNGHAFEHAHGLLGTAEAVSRAVADDPTARDSVFGACAAEADASCAEAFVETVGLRIVKRPLDDVRRASLLQGFAAAGEGLEGMRWMLTRLLQAPEAVFHVELPRSDCDGDCRTPDGVLAVDDWTVASRVAYALTGRGPDDALLQAAADGELRTLGEVRTHARRLVKMPEARRQFAAVLDSWLMLRTKSDPNVTMAQIAGMDAAGLADEARQELLEYATYMVFDADADTNALLGSAVGFPRSSRLAAIYDSDVVDGDEPVPLEGGHGGLVLRAAVLISGHLHTSPILRGAYVRKRLLCDPIPSPDPQTVAEGLEELDEADHTEFSTREIVEALTSAPLCDGCHQFVNPIGFALEGYDPLGRPRVEEIVYDDAGEEIARHPLDTHVTDPRLEGVDALDGADDLLTALAESDQLRACLAERLVSQAQLRPPQPADACAIEDVHARLSAGDSVVDAWIDAVVNPELFVRTEETSP